MSARSARDKVLTDVIRGVWEENYCVFGVRKMYAFLNNGELAVGHVARCTVERLMRRMGIRGVSREGVGSFVYEVQSSITKESAQQ